MLDMRSEVMADRKRLPASLRKPGCVSSCMKELDHPLLLYGSVEDQTRGHSEPYFYQLNRQGFSWLAVAPG